MAEVVLKNVSKIYPPNVIGVEEVNLNIKDKEYWVFEVAYSLNDCGLADKARG